MHEKYISYILHYTRTDKFYFYWILKNNVNAVVWNVLNVWQRKLKMFWKKLLMGVVFPAANFKVMYLFWNRLWSIKSFSKQLGKNCILIFTLFFYIISVYAFYFKDLFALLAIISYMLVLFMHTWNEINFYNFILK